MNVTNDRNKLQNIQIKQIQNVRLVCLTAANGKILTKALQTLHTIEHLQQLSITPLNFRPVAFRLSSVPQSQ